LLYERAAREHRLGGGFASRRSSGHRRRGHPPVVQDGGGLDSRVSGRAGRRKALTVRIVT
jgi:hypothetical protein